MTRRYQPVRVFGPVPAGVGPRRASRRRAARRRRRRELSSRVLIIVVVLLLAFSLDGVALGFAHFAGLQSTALNELRAGSSGLQAGRDKLKTANAQKSEASLAPAKSAFAEAYRHFEAARGVADRDVWVHRAEALPFSSGRGAADRVATLDAIADTGKELANAGLAAVDADRPILKGGGAGGGKGLVDLVRSIQPQVDAIRNSLARAQASAAAVDASLLPGSERSVIANIRTQINSELAAVSTYQNLVPVLFEMLGVNGPRHYIIANEDPAALQGAGGYIGSYSVISASGGDVALEKTADVLQIDAPYPTPGTPGYIAPPPNYKEYQDIGWRFGDSMFYPDFTDAGKTALRLFANQTGRQLDGIIAIDPYSLAMMLNVTGPIDIPEYNTTVQSKDFAEVVFQREEYRGGGQQYDGKKFIITVASHLVPKLLQLPSASWPAMMSTFNAAATQRHLQAYFNAPALQDEMQMVGFSGAYASVQPGVEYLREVEYNFSDNKANHFLTRHFDLTLTQRADGMLDHQLVITIRNATPRDYPVSRDYHVYVRVYVPAGSTAVATMGLIPDRFPVTEVVPATLRMVDGWQFLRPDDVVGYAEVQIAVQWTSNAVTRTSAPSQIYWQKQAGTFEDAVTIKLVTPHGSSTATTDLSRDRLVVLDSNSVKVQDVGTARAALPILGG